MLDSLETFLGEKNTKGVIILKDGRLAYEHYYGTFTRDSAWYWASAGKSLTAFLVGMAQEEGLVNIQNKSSDYLGTGWTSCTLAQEDQITLRDQLCMTTGLDDGVVDPDCSDPACLQYLAAAGTRWAYHNAPYHLVHDVLANASGQSLQLFTANRLSIRIGMQGLWYNHVYYSKLRDMARFGLLALNRGVWQNDTLMHDQSYFDAMTNTSQQYNESYGYLWWLNGKGSHMLPGMQFVFQGSIIPSAPDDMYMALGKNDQKIYVLPSRNLVVVRMGESAGALMPALSVFDDNLWEILMQVIEPLVDVQQVAAPATTVSLYPNPAAGMAYVKCETGVPDQVWVYDAVGRMLGARDCAAGQIDLSGLPSGMLVLKVVGAEGEALGQARLLKN